MMCVIKSLLSGKRKISKWQHAKDGMRLLLWVNTISQCATGHDVDGPAAAAQ